jgi:hypothetical protein
MTMNVGKLFTYTQVPYGEDNQMVRGIIARCGALKISGDKARFFAPRITRPFAVWGQAEEPGVHLRKMCRRLSRSEMSTRQ